MSNDFLIRVRRERSNVTPTDLQFGEMKFTDLDDRLHVGKADGTTASFSKEGTGNTQPGDSAYQVWLNAGNTGTVVDFLESLKGDQGDPGDSAYQVWLEAGNTGTVADFFESLRGDEGDPGSDATAPPGAVMYFAMTTPPTGWLKANGASLSRTAYAGLFAAIGTTYGSGDGSTTFNLPDLRGEFIRSWDDGRGIDSARAMGSYQADQLKIHGHTISGRRDSTSLGALNGFVRPSNSGTNFDLPDIYSLGPPDGGDETRPRNVALLVCIKY